MAEKIEMIPLPSIEDVKRFAQSLLEDSKRDLMEDGRIWRRCYIFTSCDRLPPKHGAPSEGGALVCLDLNADAAGLLEMLCACEPQVRKIMPRIREVARAMRVRDDEFAARTLAILEHARNVTGPGILAQYMRHMIEALGAYAYVHVSDTWWAQEKSGDRSKLADDLSQEPTAIEAIAVSVETHRYQEITSIPYRREARGSGKVLAFEEPRVLTTDDPNLRLSGRLYGVLREMPLN